MRVICVKWGDKYGPEWVEQLRDMVKRNFGLQHDFVCMTDNPIPGVECVECEPDLPTWWSKVGLFKPGKFPGINLYLDLDIVITASITPMMGNLQTGVIVAPDDFSYSLVRHKPIDQHTRRLLGGDGTVNSSVMIWRDDAGADIWNKFRPDKMQELHGDQNWITQALWPDKLRLLSPGWVCSYKYHVLRGAKIAPIVVFHGDPKVTSLPANNELRAAWGL